jgi:uncharacterized RDD family membrane protein YckC/energy-coupling factor transporter ATP-binding protein EcfA2
MPLNMARTIAPAILNPYPGLRPFREDEEHLFFGRERQIDRITDKLALTRFLAVVGTSGSGKSSLVNCGLRPALHRGHMTEAGTSWRIVQFRPGADPVPALTKALSAPDALFATAPDGLSLEEIVGATLRMSNQGIADLYEQAQLPPATNLLVIADQFEELFRYRTLNRMDGRDPQAAVQDATLFVNLLLAAHAQRTHRIYVVLTMRSDFLGDCSHFYGLSEAINEGQYLVPRMTRDERRAALAGPAGVAGADISPVLLTRLINDTGDNPDQLSILQHALNRTWARWQNDGEGRGALSVEWYESIGTMAHALDRHAEKAYAELTTDRARTICAKVFKALTDKGTDSRGIRRPTSLQRLCAICAASPAEVTEVIDVFRKPSRSFLMPPVPELLYSDTVIDMSHESLMRVWKRLGGWADEEAESARMYRRTQDTAVLSAAGRASLWRDPDLQSAIDWRTREQPTPAWAELYGGGLDQALSFIDRSKHDEDRREAEIEFERRWSRRFALPGAAVLFAIYALTARGFEVPIGDTAQALVPDFIEALPIVGSASVRLLELTIPAIPFVLAGIGLASWGKRAYRERAFSGIVEDAAITRVERREVPVAAPTEPATVVLATQYASFGRRAGSFLIDVAVLFGIVVACIVVGAMLDVAQWPVLDPLGDDLGEMSDAAAATIITAAMLLNVLYESLTLSSKRRATLGMMAAGIIMTDTHGRRLTFLRTIARQAARLLSYYSFGIGFFIELFTEKQQTLHDLICKTVVLRTPKDDKEAIGPDADRS